MIHINNLFVYRFFLLYLLMTAVYHFINSSFLKFSIFGLTIFMIVLLSIYVFNNIKFLSKKLFTISILLIIFLVLNLLINIGHTTISFSIKYFGLIIFFLSGYIINLNNNENSINKHQKKIILSIIFIPILVYLIDKFLLGLPDSSSLFLNRNNAVLFGIITSYFIFLYFNSIKLYLSFIVVNVIVYKTLGALIAMIVTSIIIYLKSIDTKKILILLFYSIIILTSISYFLNAFDLPIVDRAKEAINGFKVLFQLSSLEQMANMSYGKMASLSGSSDLSFLFRIKHWYNILTIYINSELINILFGHGNDTIRFLTTAELRAHNDYIRLLFETGLFYWLTFLSFNFYVVKKIGLNLYIMPYLIVLMYFFTENLIDNFLSMSLLYFIVGLIMAKKQKGLI